jgi:hypothetical protein
MYRRFPEKVKSLVLAGAPIDTDAGHGPIKKLAHTLPLETYQEMVDIGDGRMLGKTMAGAPWPKSGPRSDDGSRRRLVNKTENPGQKPPLQRQTPGES